MEAARASLREEGRPDPFTGRPARLPALGRGRGPPALRGRGARAGRLRRLRGRADRRGAGCCRASTPGPACGAAGSRGAGVAELCRSAFADGAEHVQLAVVDGNTAATALYESSAFRAFSASDIAVFVGRGGAAVGCGRGGGGAVAAAASSAAGLNAMPGFRHRSSLGCPFTPKGRREPAAVAPAPSPLARANLQRPEPLESRTLLACSRLLTLTLFLESIDGSSRRQGRDRDGRGRRHSGASTRSRSRSEGAAIVVNDLGGARDGSGGGAHSWPTRWSTRSRRAGGTAVANYDSVATRRGRRGHPEGRARRVRPRRRLVNNAGILRDKSLANMNEDMWDIVVQVHLKGTFCVTRPASSTHMKERGQGGVIINTSSTSGLNGNFGQTNYGAAKAGICGLHALPRARGQEVRHPLLRARAGRAHAPDRGSGRLRRTTKLKEQHEPALVSPLSSISRATSRRTSPSKTFFVGGGRIAEMRMVTHTGVTKTRTAVSGRPERSPRRSTRSSAG